jgi:hypothetical protein
VGTAADSAVRLEIVDAQQRIVRTYSSDSARADSLRTPRLPNRRGMHRFSWDLTYDAPRTVRGVVVWGYTGGVKAPPGTYQVRLSVGARSQTQPLRLLADPRLPNVAQADYEEQLRVALQVRDSLNAVYSAISTVRDVRAQTETVLSKAREMGRATELAPLADSLTAHLNAVEDELVQRRSQSGQDPIRFGGRLDNQYAELYGNLTGTNGYIAGGPEGRPTRGAVQRMQELNTQWMAVHQRLLRILETEVQALNAAAQRAGIPAIAVRPRIVT